MAFYWFRNYLIWFRGCQDMTISGLHVILTWLGDYLLVMSQNRIYKLWENYGKWGKIVPIRGHSFQSIQLHSTDQLQSVFDSLSVFLNLKKTALFMFWIQGNQTDLATGVPSSLVQLLVFRLVADWTLKHYIHTHFISQWPIVCPSCLYVNKSHLGNELSHRDDLELLVYILIYLLHRLLSWHNGTQMWRSTILNLKQRSQCLKIFKIKLDGNVT